MIAEQLHPGLFDHRQVFRPLANDIDRDLGDLPGAAPPAARARPRLTNTWTDEVAQGRQALLLLAYLRKDHTFADLAGFAIGTAIGSRYVTENRGPAGRPIHEAPPR